MTLSDEIISKGISKVQFKSKPFYKMYVHPKKAFRAYMASSSNSAYYNDFSKIHVSHEILNMLDYDGKPCIEENVTNYNFYQKHNK